MVGMEVSKMLKDDATLMFENYRQLMDHLVEKKDEKGLDIFCEVVKNTDLFVSGLFKLHEKVVFQIKEGSKTEFEEVKEDKK